MNSLRVRLNPPRIDGDTVWFTWEEDTGLPAPPDGGLFYRYEEIDLRQFSDELWMEIFLALRLGAYARLGNPVTLQLPFAVPQRSIDFWRTYHGAVNVVVSPTSQAAAYSPWSGFPGNLTGDVAAAVFFGGGRDSLATACLLGEVYGRERVLLVQCIDPHQPGEERRQAVAQRFERWSLGPARDELGFRAQRVWTNLHAIALGEGGKPNEPHMEQYTAGHLPVLLAWNARFSTFCGGWFEYLIFDTSRGGRFYNPGSRPEILAAQTRHYQRVLLIDHTVTNVNLIMTGVSSFQLTAQRYPDAFPHLMMCVSAPPGEQWCYRCAKCGRYGWHLLAEKIDDPRLDMNRLFGRGDWMNSIVENLRMIESEVHPGENAPWDERFWHPLNSIDVGDLFARADPAFAVGRLIGDAWFNFVTVKAMYGNHYQPMFHTAPMESFGLLPDGLGARLRPVIETVVKVVDQGQDKLINSRGTPRGPFAATFHVPLLDLPHVQESPA